MLEHIALILISLLFLTMTLAFIGQLINNSKEVEKLIEEHTKDVQTREKGFSELVENFEQEYLSFTEYIDVLKARSKHYEEENEDLKAQLELLKEDLEKHNMSCLPTLEDRIKDRIKENYGENVAVLSSLFPPTDRAIPMVGDDALAIFGKKDDLEEASEE